MVKKPYDIQSSLIANKSLMLATSKDNIPHSSYACFAYDQKSHNFYILVASISRHTANIRENSNISGMLIVDEQSTKEMWFRQRIHYDFKASILKEPSSQIITLLKNKLGLGVLQFLKMNFKVIKLQIVKGLMVTGPGQAFEIDVDNQIKQIQPPKKKNNNPHQN